MRLVAYRKTMANAKPVADTGINIARRSKLLLVHGDRGPRLPHARAKSEPVVAKTAPKLPANIQNSAHHRKIIASVAGEHGMTYAELMQSGKDHKIVAARFAAITAIYQQWRRPDGSPHSLPEIGRVFGRDHTTILNALRRTGAIPEPSERAITAHVRKHGEF